MKLHKIKQHKYYIHIYGCNLDIDIKPKRLTFIKASNIHMRIYNDNSNQWKDFNETTQTNV